MITQQPILDVKRYWIGSLIGAAGSIIGSALASGSQSSANKANMELAKYRYEKDLEMWNRQNAYNTPAAQMQRYATAGINPNTVVSQGSNGNASSAPSFEAPEMKPYTGYGDLGAGTVANAILRKFEIDNQTKSTESQTALNSANENKAAADALLANQRAQTEFWQGLYKAREYGIFDEFGEQTAREQLELIKSNQSKIKQDIEESKSRVDLNQSNISVNNQKVQNLKSEFDLIGARIGLTKAQTSLVFQDIAESVSRVNLNDLSAEQQRKVIDSMGDPEKMKDLNEREKEASVLLSEIQRRYKDFIPSDSYTGILASFFFKLSRSIHGS